MLRACGDADIVGVPGDDRVIGHVEQGAAIFAVAKGMNLRRSCHLEFDRAAEMIDLGYEAARTQLKINADGGA